MLSVINKTTTSETTDQWETAHIASYTGLWDHTHEILQRVGYDTQIDAQFIDKIRGEREFDHFQGYWDEGPSFPSIYLTTLDSLPFFWDYVDHIRSRKPRNRMYLTWQSQVTHVYLPLNPAWLENNYQPFTIDQPDTQPTDRYLNGLKETDDLVKEIILGFRERGLEDETLFVM